METIKKVDEYRKKLDKSLLAHSLVDDVRLRKLVKKQVLCSADDLQEGSIEKLVQKRMSEVSNLLDMLRSGSEKYVKSPRKPYASWKVKQDNEKFRSMYREGVNSASVHTFFVDGYVDAPLDSCLYVTYETPLYPIGFPESRFHKLAVDYHKRIRLGEQVSLLRLKLAWPLPNREILLRYSVFEYYEDDLVLVFLNTISGEEDFCKETDGFTNSEIPGPNKASRVDLIGGIIFQKVSETKTFLRLILDADIKSNFIPSYLVNFVTGKLSGTAFKLYDKWVTRISKEEGTDVTVMGKVIRTMENPLCERICDALYPDRNRNKDQESISVSSQDDLSQPFASDDYDDTSSVYESVIGWNDDSTDSDEDDDAKGRDASNTKMENYMNKKMDQLRVQDQADPIYFNKNKVALSPSVGHEIGTLEEAICAIREGSPKTKRCRSISAMINMRNLRLGRAKSYAKETNRALPESNHFYAREGDSITSYIIQNRMIKPSHPNEDSQQQIIVEDTKYVSGGKIGGQKEAKIMRKWALSCIHAPVVSQ